MRLPSRKCARPNKQMPHLQPSRVPFQLFAPVFLLALASTAGAQLFRDRVPGGLPVPDRSQTPPAAQPQSQATLPPTPPTALPTANSLPAPLAATPDGPTGPPQRAVVTFANGNLNVHANNSSLHQILRSIARQTGMKISGGVADQRVYGDYGPADPSAVLATLLDGTGVNMLLKQDENRSPVQLVLTPRSGEGPAAPATDIPDIADDVAPSPAPAQTQPVLTGTAPPLRQPEGPVSIPQPDNNINGSPSSTSPTASTFPTTNSVPIDSIPTPSTTPSTTGIVDAPNPPPPGSTTSASPNGVATPDQIYQQLLKLQQQRAQQGTSPAPTPPPPQ